MNQLFGWLKGLEYKTALATALMAALTFIESAGSLLGQTTILWIDLVCLILLVIGKGIAPTGVLPKGWTAFLWITNICVILINIGAVLTDSGLFSESVALIVTKVQIVLNGIIAALQVAQTQKQVS